MSITFNVAQIGFNKPECDKITKSFQISGHRKKSYHLVNIDDQVPTHIIIINSDSTSNQEILAYVKRYPGKIATYSKTQTTQYDQVPHIKGMLLATRIINTLDAIEISEGLPSIKRFNWKDQKSGGLYQTTDVKIAERPVINADLASKDENSFKVLVVDDSESMQKNLAKELGKADQAIDVDFAGDGVTAMGLINKNMYDFIFLDIMMPGMDGYETCAEIRKIDAMKKTPVIMLSAKTSPLDEVKGVMAGCTSYLTKPIKKEEFQKMLTRVMTWLNDFKQPQIAKEI